MGFSCLNCEAKEQEEIADCFSQKPKRILLCLTVLLYDDTPILYEQIHKGFRLNKVAETQSISCLDSAFLSYL